ncbi:MAG: hypothetical protein ABR542_05060, partial [Desulfonatronovibrio sp.]
MSNILRFFPVFVLLCVLCVAGCGKKVWPEPDDSQEKFTVSIKDYQIINDDCLNVYVEIQGAQKNIAGMTLELEASDDPCPTCPFQANTTTFIEPGSSMLRHEQGQMIIRNCGIDPDKHYRARLKAKNIYSIIR